MQFLWILVRWSGYSEEWDTWENEENIHTIEMIRDFEKNFEKTQELTYFIPKHMYAVQTGRQVHSILGLDKDDRYGVIALVTYEKLQEEKVQAELVPTEVLADDEEASQILLNYYENYKLY
jgi:hypothetical protein